MFKGYLDKRKKEESLRSPFTIQRTLKAEKEWNLEKKKNQKTETIVTTESNIEL